MNLGEKIYMLRTERGLSQGDLADALEVSRQSVSKWETDASVPELDKLVKLSALFGVSLDELVLDKKLEAAPVEPQPRIVYVERVEKTSSGKTVGMVLLCFAAMLFLLITLFGDIFAGLVLASPFACCGLICMLVKKYPALWCMWVLYSFIDIYLRFATGISWQYALYPLMYTEGWTLHLIVAWCLLACFGVLTVVTALCTRKTFPGTLRSDVIGAVSGWAAYAVTWFLFMLPSYELQYAVTYPHGYRYISAVTGWFRSALLVAAVVFTLRLAVRLLKKRKD